MNFLDQKLGGSSNASGRASNETGGDVSDNLMAARRRALQLQREEREAKQRRDGQLPSTQTNTTSSSPFLGVAQSAKMESSVPSDTLGDPGGNDSKKIGEGRGNPNGIAAEGNSGHSGGGRAGVPSFPMGPTNLLHLSNSAYQQKGKGNSEKESHGGALEESEGETVVAGFEESVSALRQKVLAKKKLLQSLREKESALMEKVRSEKAHKKAEVTQLEARLRVMWEKVESEKKDVESKIRESRDEHEKLLLDARRQAELVVRQEYEPQIAQLQLKFEALQKEEKRLKEILEQEGDTKNLLDNAVASATNAIIERLHELFSVRNETEMAKWNNEVEELVRHEVRSSFAVGVGTEAQSERESLQKYFYDMLELWKQVEEEERERILKMDDNLLLDIQKMAQDNISRLQNEEMALEEVYIQSREAWATQHQKMLDVEQEAALQRRELDFNEQRVLLNQLHDERMKFVEEHHEEEMKLEETHHQKELRLLREFSQREEELQDRQYQTLLSTHQEVQNATQSLEVILNIVAEIAKSMTEYQEEVDQSRMALDDEQIKALEERERMLESIKEILINQQRAVEGQHKQLSSTVVELSSLENAIQAHLHEEERWLAQQEASSTASREEWQREYRKWKQMIEMERCRTEEQFSEALSALQTCITAMEHEEREVKVEMNAMTDAFVDLAHETKKEVQFLDTRERELQVRHESLKEVLQQLGQQSSEMAEQYQNLVEQRKQLGRERTRITNETAKFKQFENTVQLLQSVFPTALNGSSPLSAPPRLHNETIVNSKGKKKIHENTFCSVNVRPYRERWNTEKPLFREGHYREEQRSRSGNAERLPLQVLQELEQQLHNLVFPTQTGDPISAFVIKGKKHNTETNVSKHDPKHYSRHTDPLNPIPLNHATKRNSSRPYSSTDVHSSGDTSTDDDPHNSSATNTFTNLISFSDHSHSSR